MSLHYIKKIRDLGTVGTPRYIHGNPTKKFSPTEFLGVGTIKLVLKNSGNRCLLG
jgi:hypothetical protein